nr:hypothetical protein [Tanacetum cinerariifolium]
MNKRRRKRGKDEGEANAPPKVLRKDHTAFRPAQSTLGGKSLAPMGSSRKTATEIPSGNVVTIGVQGLFSTESPESGKSTSFPSGDRSPGGIYQPGWGVTNNCCLDTPDACQDMVDHIVPLRLDQEIKALRVMEVEMHVLRNQRKNLETMLEAEVSNLQAQVTGEEKIKAAFKEFKRYEDGRVKHRCTEMDARLDKLSVDFDEELYPHMLTAIAGRLVKGINEGLKHDIEHGRANRDLAAIKVYDLEADSKYVKALQDLKDLSSSQLKIPIYPEVLDPEDPWAFKEEVLLEDAIAANRSWAEKKKKCRVVCHTHGVGFAHHTRSDGIPVSVPTVAPRGLTILLVDATTQTEVADQEDEPSPRLQRSISLPPFYNLEWK